MSNEPKWIDDTESLVRELQRLGSDGFSVDTEADSMHHFQEKVCLIQISNPGVDLLIDPLAEIDLEMLGALLADPTSRKILHGADYDVRMLQRDFSFEIRGLYDTMIAARLAGESAFGLAALLDKYIGVKLDKQFQRADWSIRPLSGPMLQYASSDTHYLEELAVILDGKLESLGRVDWAKEEFERLEQVRPRTPLPPEEAYSRLKGVGRLDRRTLAVLRELVTLRDGIACRRDVPRYRAARDEVLFSLADAATSGSVDLSRISRLPRSWRSGAPNRSLLEAIERGLAVPDEELPESLSRVRPERDRDLEARVKVLKKGRDRLAEELELDPSMLAPRAVLEEVSRRLAAGQAPREVPELRRWQADLLAPVFEQGG